MLIDELKDVKSYFENDNEINIVLNTFDYLEHNEKSILANGYHFKEKKNRIFYYENKTKIVMLSICNNNLKTSRLMPDYTNSMVNLTSSIKKFYGLESKYQTSSKLDSYLDKNYKHIVFLILDGLGPYIIKEALKPGDILYDNLKETISAVFPPTTACAIPCSASAKLALETAWLGWENYIKEIDRNIVLFTGENYVTKEPTCINLKKGLMKYDEYFYSLGVDAKDFEPNFRPGGYETFDDLLKGLKKHISKDVSTFTYAYWGEPDSTLHLYGVGSPEANSVIKSLNDSLAKCLKGMKDDTLVIVTADHGHQNVINTKLYEYKDLYAMLERMPSNEGRSLTFKVKKEFHQQFKVKFEHYFSDYYDLYSKDDFLKLGFLGDINKFGYNQRLDDFLGDFIAIASNELYLEYVDFKDDAFHFKSAHAGITKNEMETPLIIIKK